MIDVKRDTDGRPKKNVKEYTLLDEIKFPIICDLIFFQAYRSKKLVGYGRQRLSLVSF